MSLKSWLAIVLLLIPCSTFAQSTNQIRTRNELIAALCLPNQNQQAREVLLNSHPELVNPELLTELNRLADAFYRLSPEQSFIIYEVAVQVAIHLREPELIGTTYYNLGRVYSASNQFSKAIVVYEKSRAYLEQAGSRRDLVPVLSDLGATYFILEDFQEAKDYSERSLALAEKFRSTNALADATPDLYGRARALQTLADINLRERDHSKAVKTLQESLTLYQQLNPTEYSRDFYIAGDLMALGRVYTEVSDNFQALAYLNKAVEIVGRIKDPDMMASLRNSIGVLYTEQEDYAQARAQFDLSLEIYTEGKNQREASRVLLNLGVIEQRQERYDAALTSFRSSLQIAKETKNSDVTIAASEGIAVVLTAKKDFGAALEIVNQNLSTAKDSGNRVRQAELTWRLSQTYFGMKDYARATSTAESAGAMSRASHLPKLNYLALTVLGESYAAQGKSDLAIQVLKQAVAQLESLRDEVAGYELETQLFLENKLAPYHALVDLFIQQGKPVEALLYAERAKGRVLLDVVSSTERDFSSELSPSQKEEKQRLNRKIYEINDTIRKQAADSPSLDSLYTQLDDARLQYQSFQDALYVDHPKLRLQSGITSALTSDHLTDLMQDNDTGYLEYVVANDRVSLFVLTNDKSGSRRNMMAYPIQTTPADLVLKINQFHNALAERRPDYQSQASELFKILIQPAEKQLHDFGTICIVPDDFLWNLPFQALMTDSEHFLIEKQAIYYAPSLSVLREINGKRSPIEKKNSTLIAFGNPIIDKDEQRNADLCPLPEAETEVTSIAHNFEKPNAKILIGRDATEKTFKGFASNYSLVHLATHGVIDNRHPLYSHLLLTRTDGDVENDGRLEAREIMNLRLNSDLVVLSACETANGRVAPGEGVMGMSWSFFVAGSRSLVISQWQVNSASTSKLMEDFYAGLGSRAQSDTKAMTLRQAALNLLKDPRYVHPFYWAPFVLVGSN